MAFEYNHAAILLVLKQKTNICVASFLKPTSLNLDVRYYL